MGTRAVVLLDNPSFLREVGDGTQLQGRADSGFYVHYDGYPDTLGAALLQMGQSGAFEASSLVASGEISYFSGIYPSHSAPTSDEERLIDLGGGAQGLAGVDNSPMGDYFSNYILDMDGPGIGRIELDDSDMGDADYIYVVAQEGAWCISVGYGEEQTFGFWGDSRFASRVKTAEGNLTCPACGWVVDPDLFTIFNPTPPPTVGNAYTCPQCGTPSDLDTGWIYDSGPTMPSRRASVGRTATSSEAQDAADDIIEWIRDEPDMFGGASSGRSLEDEVDRRIEGQWSDEVAEGDRTEQWWWDNSVAIRDIVIDALRGEWGVTASRHATRYPEIEVELIGQDGNAFNLLGIVQKALRRGGVPQSEIDEFMDEATSGDYDHLLQTCMEWVEVY